MVSKKYRVITATILAFASLGAFNSFANGAEPSYGSFLLGNPCSTAYVSQAIVDEKNPGKNLNVICYESSDSSSTLIWTEDQNSEGKNSEGKPTKAAYEYPEGKAAFGRPINKAECTFDLDREPFIRDFPDTKCDLEKKVWWSDTYAIKIIDAEFSPTPTPSPESTPSPEPTSSEPVLVKFSVCTITSTENFD